MKAFLLLPFRLVAVTVTLTAMMAAAICWVPVVILDSVFGRGPNEE